MQRAFYPRTAFRMEVFLIKPGVEDANLGLTVIRADEIVGPGSFVRDIVEYLAGAFAVIADLTDQNANVFYELGVRHALVGRTIMIAQAIEHLPSDLRDYRTIIYNTTPKGTATFRTRLAAYLKEIAATNPKPDNPVSDCLGAVLDIQNREYRERIALLEADLAAVLERGKPNERSRVEAAHRRVVRILKINKAQEPLAAFTLQGTSAKAAGLNLMNLPQTEGEFRPYIINSSSVDGQVLLLGVEVWYIASPRELDIDRELADLRVVLAKEETNRWRVKFVLATTEDLSGQRQALVEAFERMLGHIQERERGRFSFVLWDAEGLIDVERSLGIRMERT